MIPKKKKLRQQPKSTGVQEEVGVEQIWDEDGFSERVFYHGGDVSYAEESRLRFDDVRVKDVLFAGSRLRQSEFIDVIFDTCDFSNVDFGGSIFHRCEFLNCKLTGTNFGESKMGHVLMQGCEGRYSRYNFSTMAHTEFLDCHLEEVDFFECTLKEMKFERCKMNGINFTETDLKGIDLSTNTYDQIEVSLPKIAGCIVSKEQALGFARVLGLAIKEN